MGRFIPNASRRLRLVCAIGALAAAFGVAAELNDVLFVTRPALPIRGGKYAFDKVLATAKKGDKLKVTAVEGHWLKVAYPSSAGPVEGYVLEYGLSARAVELPTTRDTGNAAQVGATAASHGLLDSGKFAASKGLSPDPLNKMINDSQKAMSNSDAEFEAFEKAGALGPFKPQPSRFAPTSVPATSPALPTTNPTTGAAK